MRVKTLLPGDLVYVDYNDGLCRPGGELAFVICRAYKHLTRGQTYWILYAGARREFHESYLHLRARPV